MSKRMRVIVGVLVLFGGVPKAHASLSQTLVFSRALQGSVTYAGTLEEWKAAIEYPMVAMTVDVASFVDSLRPGQAEQCDVTALRQDTNFGSPNVVWNVYAVSGCKPLSR